MPHCRTIAIWATLLAACWVAGAGRRAAADEQPRQGPLRQDPRQIQFNRDVRPILSDHCWNCHGPDSQARQAELRLDRREGLYSRRDDGLVVTPESPAESLLWRRVSHEDAEQRMPPPDSPKPLSAEQRRTLRRWIEQGAVWEDHWSFLTPRRPAPPTPPEAHRGWIRNPIDRFVLARLAKQGIDPAPEAAYEALVRRVTLDLTGLPPTRPQLDQALGDRSPGRYERLVDRLLASPAYGEHMAVAWLDAARYADTSGYQNDGPRYMWRWRDWVIESLNADLPFDQFTIQQLAGDLLPDATPRQQLATGFNRNHRGNAEGGIVPEEFAVEYVVDRVDTTGAVWLGLTIGCARCHSHKFDPISQQEYYRLFAYFNNIPEHGRAIKEGNSPPYLPTPTPAQLRRLEMLRQTIGEAERRWQTLAPQREAEQRRWEQRLASGAAAPDDYVDRRALRLHAPLDGSLQAWSLAAPADLVARGDSLLYVPAPTGKGAALSGAVLVDGGDVGNFGYFDAFSVSAWVRPEAAASGGIVSRMSDDSYSDGWALHLQEGRVQVNLVKRWLDDSLRVELPEPLAPGRWQHVQFTYDGSRRADGIAIYVDGRLRPHRTVLDALNQTITNDQPLRIGATGSRRRLKGAVADVRVYARKLSADEALVAATPQSVRQVAEMDVAKRTAGQQLKVEAAYLHHGASDQVRQAARRRRELRRQLRQLESRIPTTMVMQERSKPAAARVLGRGAYDQPGERVEPGIPAVLLRGEPPEGNDRLALARWIVSPQNPLTARVAVNRQWQRFFGRGLVETSEDFGSQGSPPTHPLLLDFLATEYQRLGWSTKRLQWLIVNSATYRQSSAARRELQDPSNRLLARGPRLRLSAEMVRDQALAAAGLLQRRVGGPSVFPYQIDGLWNAIATDTQYRQSQGGDLYRRGVYCYVKRTVSHPTFAAFDAPNREACVVRRSSTNTALQALALMNDVTFVEAARHLAARSCRETGADATSDGRLAWMFRQLTSRRPEARELEVLRRGLEHHRRRFEKSPQQAARLLETGDAPAAAPVPQPELAALTVMASVIMNLDEVVNRR